MKKQRGPRPVESPETVTQERAMAAVRDLLVYIGEDPTREGLRDTPERVVRAYRELFAGYAENPAQHLSRTFDDVEGYRDVVLVRDIAFASTCEHHLMPFHGIAHVAYLPAARVVGLSKVARLVEGYARRLQTQERLTAQIANAFEETLEPRGVAIMLEATHGCMTLRGIQSPQARTTTTEFRGAFRDEPRFEGRFFDLLREKSTTAL